MRVRFTPIIFTTLCLMVSVPALAQEAFSTVTIRAGGTTFVGTSAIEEHWEPGSGGELALAAPFHLGEVELGSALHAYEAVDSTVPSFSAILAYVGWALDLSPAKAVSWRSGVLVGNYRMSFDEATFAGVRNESELAMGLKTRVELRATPSVSLYAAGHYLRIYTAPRFEQAFLSGGVGLRLDSPSWLEKVLR